MSQEDDLLSELFKALPYEWEETDTSEGPWLSKKQGMNIHNYSSSLSFPRILECSDFLSMWRGEAGNWRQDIPSPSLGPLGLK